MGNFSVGDINKDLSYFIWLDFSQSYLEKYISCIHSNPINIRWIRSGSHPYEKSMSSIVLYPVFYKFKMYNHKIKTNFFIFHISYPRNIFYNTMREITITWLELYTCQCVHPTQIQQNWILSLLNHSTTLQYLLNIKKSLNDFVK